MNREQKRAIVFFFRSCGIDLRVGPDYRGDCFSDYRAMFGSHWGHRQSEENIEKYGRNKPLSFFINLHKDKIIKNEHYIDFMALILGGKE